MRPVLPWGCYSADIRPPYRQHSLCWAVLRAEDAAPWPPPAPRSPHFTGTPERAVTLAAAGRLCDGYPSSATTVAGAALARPPRRAAG
eukprot:6203046-Pleurochrysis_carterae.AAC.4